METTVSAYFLFFFTQLTWAGAQDQYFISGVCGSGAHPRNVCNLTSAIDAAKQNPATGSDEIQFVFSPDTHAVNATEVSFDQLRNLSRVTLMSRTGKATIVCTEKNAHMRISDFPAFRIENLTFVGCTFSFVSVDTVSIIGDSAFVNSSGRAVSVFNSMAVTVSGVVFESSPRLLSSGIELDVRQTRGAVQVLISRCRFNNLSVTGTKLDSIRHGAGIVATLQNTTHLVYLTISQCHFYRTWANGGGAFHLMSSGTVTADFIMTIQNVTFTECLAAGVSADDDGDVRTAGNGGAVSFNFFHVGSGAGHVVVSSSTFETNRAEQYGSAIYVAGALGANDFTIENTVFNRNVAETGGALAVINVNGSTAASPLVIRNSVFHGNYIHPQGAWWHWRDLRGGAVVLMDAAMLLDGNVTVLANENSSFALWGSILRVKGRANFSENRHHDFREDIFNFGAALSLSCASALEVHDSAVVSFNGNVAKRGGVIYVSDDAPTIVSRTMGNRLCFIRGYPDVDAALNKSFIFNKNHVALPVIASERQRNCVGYFLKNFSDSDIRRGNDQPEIFVNITVPTVNEAERKLSKDVLKCKDYQDKKADYCLFSGIGHVFTLATNFSFLDYPNDVISIQVSSRKEELMFTLNENTDREHVNWVSSHSYLLNGTNVTSSDISFAGLLDGQPTTLEITPILIRYGESVLKEPKVVTRTILLYSYCPAGHNSTSVTRDSKLSTCNCSDVSVRNSRIASCRWDGGILPSAGFWIGSDSNNTVSFWCPDGYCRCSGKQCWFDARDLDLQCQEGRRGKLCGECREGWVPTFHSPGFIQCVNVSSGNKADSCWKIWQYWLLVVGASMAIVLFAVAIKIDVTSGYLPPFLFFFQVASFVLSTSQTSGLLARNRNLIFINYLFFLPNLYLPAAPCVGASATTNTTLSANSSHLSYIYQAGIASFYALPAFVFFFMILFSIAARRVSHISKFKVLRPFWSLITLGYISISYTTIAVLFCVPVQDGTKTDWVWYYNAESVKCFGENHWWLALIAIIVLLFVIAFPLLVAFTLRNISCLHAMADVARNCFKEEYYWAEGMNFGRRLLVVMAFTFASIGGRESRYMTLLVVLTILLAVHTVLQPYRKPKKNWLETFLLGDLLFLAILQGPFDLESEVIFGLSAFLLGLPYVLGLLFFIRWLYKKIRRYGKQKANLKKDDAEEDSERLLVDRQVGNTERSTSTPSYPIPLRIRGSLYGNSSQSGTFGSRISRYEQDTLMDDTRHAFRDPLLETSIGKGNVKQQSN